MSIRNIGLGARQTRNVIARAEHAAAIPRYGKRLAVRGHVGAADADGWVEIRAYGARYRIPAWAVVESVPGSLLVERRCRAAAGLVAAQTAAQRVRRALITAARVRASTR